MSKRTAKPTPPPVPEPSEMMSVRLSLKLRGRIDKYRAEERQRGRKISIQACVAQALEHWLPIQEEALKKRGA